MTVDNGNHGGAESPINRVDGNDNTIVQAGAVHGDIFVGVERPDPPRQLPAPPEHHTNYAAQLAAITAGAAHPNGQDGPRTVVVRGAPGSGRSTLCLVWAHQHGDDYPDGHFLVSLGHTGRVDPERLRVVLGDLLGALGVHPDRMPASLEGRSGLWRSRTAGRRVLLVVDDAASAAQVRALLPGRGRSVVLVVESGDVTALRATTAVRFVAVDPLDADAARLLLGRLAGSERVAAEPDAVDRLVDRCAGLAGALCVTGALLAELEHRPFVWLADKFADDEHALAELSRDPDLSLRVVFDNAYACLPELARAAYRVLGAHPGGDDVALTTIAAVLDVPAGDAAAACARLARVRLVTEPTEDRFALAGLARPHARQVAADTAATLCRATVAYYLDRAVAASLAWMPNRGWFAALWPGLTGAGRFTADSARAWLRAERANLRAATRATVELGEPDWAARFAVALWPLHDQDKYPHDMADVNDIGLAGTRGMPWARGALLAAVLGTQRGFAARQLDRLDEAATFLDAARRDAVEAESRPAEATAVEGLGLVRRDQGRRAEARELLRHNAELARALGPDRRVAMALFHLGTIEPPAVAGALLADAAELLRAEPSNETYTLVKIELWRGKKLIEARERPCEAGRILAEAADTARAGGWPDIQAQCCEARADLALITDDRAGAVTHLGSAYEIYRVQGMTARAALVADRIAELG